MELSRRTEKQTGEARWVCGEGPSPPRPAGPLLRPVRLPRRGHAAVLTGRFGVKAVDSPARRWPSTRSGGRRSTTPGSAPAPISRRHRAISRTTSSSDAGDGRPLPRPVPGLRALPRVEGVHRSHSRRCSSCVGGPTNQPSGFASWISLQAASRSVTADGIAPASRPTGSIKVRRPDRRRGDGRRIHDRTVDRNLAATGRYGRDVRDGLHARFRVMGTISIEMRVQEVERSNSLRPDHSSEHRTAPETGSGAVRYSAVTRLRWPLPVDSGIPWRAPSSRAGPSFCRVRPTFSVPRRCDRRGPHRASPACELALAVSYCRERCVMIFRCGRRPTRAAAIS